MITVLLGVRALAGLTACFLSAFVLAQSPWIPRDLHDEGPSSAWHYLPQHGQAYDVAGNYRDDVYFHSVGTYPTIYGMKNNRIAICVPKPDPPSHANDSLFRVDFAFAGHAAHDAVPVFVEQTDRRYNFYEQYTPDGVIGVTGARRVVYPSVYDSIDVHLYSNKWGPKMYIVVRPGGNPEHIKTYGKGTIA